MFGFPLSRQLQSLFPFLGLGFFLGLLYDVLRILRLSLSRSKRLLFWFDLFFVLLSALFTFCFSLSVYYGELHLYMLLAELLGFFVFYCTFDGFFRQTAAKAARWLGSVYSLCLRVLSLPIRGFLLVGEKAVKFFGFSGNKIQKKLKNLLQKRKHLLYNKGRYPRLSPRKRKRATSDEKA